MKEKIKKICLICNKNFHVVPSLNRIKFCSRKCYEVDWVKRIPGWNKGKKLHYEVWNKGKKNPAMSGKNNPNWKGGRDISNGYVRLQINGEAILEHRYKMEKHLGRKLKKSEHIHHINGIKTDNRLKNLMIVTQKVHMSVFHPPQPRGGTELRECINCKKIIKTYLSNNNVFCSKKCFFIKRSVDGKLKIYKKRSK